MARKQLILVRYMPLNLVVFYQTIPKIQTFMEEEYILPQIQLIL